MTEAAGGAFSSEDADSTGAGIVSGIIRRHGPGSTIDGSVSDTFAALLRRHRQASGLSQEDLAERAGLSVQAISALERGIRRHPYRDTIDLLAGALGLSDEDRALLHAAVSRRRGATTDIPAALKPAADSMQVPVTTFIGREHERAVVRRLLRSTRLLTLTGAGGIGKTRLAQQVATDLTGQVRDGVRFVGLADLADPALIARAVAQALGLRESPSTPLLDNLIETLRDRTLLLLLDNCEHLRAAAGELAATLLRGCPNLSILATSREALGVIGETVWWVPSLSLPEMTANGGPPRHSARSVLQAEAGELFCVRALAAHPAFALTESNAPAIATICRRLDGIPLAIELAAARARILTPEQIAARLDARFRLLTGGDAAIPRHTTLRAALDWSYDLLTEPERLLLQRLSIFSGGCEIDAAEAVCSDWPQGSDVRSGSSVMAFVPSDALFDLLTSLVEKSLITVEYRGDTARYRLLESVREYAAERLTTSGAAEAVQRRRRDWAIDLAEHAAPLLAGPEQVEWSERLETEHDNMRAVLRLAVDSEESVPGLRLAGALWRFWQARGYLTEGRHWLTRLLAIGGAAPPSVRAATLLGAGSLAHDQGDYTIAQSYVEQSLALYQETDEHAAADALLLLGALAFRRSDYRTAAARCQESLAIARIANDQRLAMRCHNLLGLIALDQGQYPTACSRFEESLALSRTLGDLRTGALALNNLGLTAHRMEEYERGREYLETSLDFNRGLNNRTEITRNLITLAVVARAQNDSNAALGYAQEALALAEDMRNWNGATEALNQLTGIARERGDLVAAQTYSIAHLQKAREIRYPIQMLAAVTEAAANARAAGQADRALRLLAAAEAHREAMGLAQHRAMQQTVDEHRLALSDLLGDPASTVAWAEGSAMSPDEAIAYALSGTVHKVRVPGPD
ncbi:MAG: tetratricopeptide repeat protein [Dehalococcoidia bacterium]